MDRPKLGPAIEAAIGAVDKAIAKEMRTADGAPALPHLAKLRADLAAMRDRNAVDPDELRAVIRRVAVWAPQDDISLLSSLGVIARAQ